MTDTGSKVVPLEPRSPEFSEDNLALRFADQYGRDLRYVDKWGKWLIWDGRRWQFDDTRKVFDLSRTVCRAASAQCNEKWAKAIAGAQTVYGVTNLARADRKLAATVAQWDADPWLLSTPAGTVDLRSGALRPHSAENYITKITGVAPDPSCKITLWRSVLDRAAGGDQALQDYLQRLFGYALTGSTREHSLLFAYGRGANSKGTILNAITGCMGEYHRTAPVETFTASNVDRHPTDLAGLHGARLVTAVETEEGRRWAESRIKQLTGGDIVSARFMRQDFFDYTPQFTLIIVGNHKPGLRSVDEAIRRRFHLIPFNVTIRREERDPELGDKLKAEWPGILQWCIVGCIAWQEQGLNPPAAVIDATAAYLEAEDATAAWIEDECERDPNAWERTTNLFSAWRSWADRTGEYAGAQKRFVLNLEARGFKEHRKNYGRGFDGIRLKTGG